MKSAPTLATGGVHWQNNHDSMATTARGCPYAAWCGPQEVAARWPAGSSALSGID
jgi:hypothetical protein